MSQEMEITIAKIDKDAKIAEIATIQKLTTDELKQLIGNMETDKLKVEQKISALTQDYARIQEQLEQIDVKKILEENDEQKIDGYLHLKATATRIKNDLQKYTEIADYLAKCLKVYSDALKELEGGEN